MQLRPYQNEAVAAVYEHLQSRDDNPCVVLPTGSGKSLVIARICSDAVLRWGGRVLILAHVKELLQQNADKLHRLAPDVEFGIYSAGLKSRQTKAPVIIAGIQSVYEKACELGAFDLILIDESHLLPENGEGMYRTFVKEAKIVNPNVRLIGFTATPYRMTSGLICKPENLLNHICYEKGIKELINEGYLCRIHTKVPAQKIDCADIRIRNGEFRSDDVSERFASETAVHSILKDIIDKTRDRNKIIVFCCDVAQATLFQEKLARYSEQAGLITGGTPAHERAELIARFQDKPTGLLNEIKPLRWLVNVNVLTTGFDAPNIDCVVLARPTLSPGLFYQMVGRSLRNAPNKTDALVLDYGSNILRHGAIDAIKLKTKNDGAGVPPLRECPECHLILPVNVSRCALCGYVFPIPEPEQKESKLDSTASQEGILSGQQTEITYEVQEISYGKHYKKNGTPDDPPTLRIEYQVGFNEYVKKWVCPEHKSDYVRSRFMAWWRQRCLAAPPTTVDEALYYAENGYLAVPQHITVIKTSGQRFDEIIEHDFTEKPTPPEEATPQTNYEQPKTCGDCHLYFHGNCPYATGLFGDEPACEHFLVHYEVVNDDVPF